MTCVEYFWLWLALSGAPTDHVWKRANVCQSATVIGAGAGVCHGDGSPLQWDRVAETDCATASDVFYWRDDATPMSPRDLVCVRLLCDSCPVALGSPAMIGHARLGGDCAESGLDHWTILVSDVSDENWNLLVYLVLGDHGIHLCAFCPWSTRSHVNRDPFVLTTPVSESLHLPSGRGDDAGDLLLLCLPCA